MIEKPVAFCIKPTFCLHTKWQDKTLLKSHHRGFWYSLLFFCSCWIELSSGGNYIEMYYNEEEILMRRQGWKNITQSKRNESIWRQNANDCTEPSDYISGAVPRSQIYTWPLPGPGQKWALHRSGVCAPPLCLLLVNCFLGGGKQYSQRCLASFFSMFSSDKRTVKIQGRCYTLPHLSLCLITHRSWFTSHELL